MSEPLTPEQRAEKLQSVVVATVEFDTGHKLSTSQSELVTEQATKHIRAAVDAERERNATVVDARAHAYAKEAWTARKAENRVRGKKMHQMSEECTSIAAAIRKGEPT